MDKDRVWSYIHGERHVLADYLAALDADQWEHDSLCAGWTVRDVAAHLISTPQTGWREIARWSPESILEQYDRYADSRHHVPVTTHVEPLLDALVHTQDILRPLGIERDMPVEAAAFAANRAYAGAFFFGMAGRLRPLRLVATDTDWTRGRGDRVVEAPMQELLMFVTGRSAARVSVG